MADQVALGVQTPDAMHSLSSMMNIAGGAQQLQAGQIANQANSAALQEKQNIRGLFADGGKQYMDAQGNLDFNKLGPDMLAAAPTTGAQTMQQMYGAQKDAVAARQSLLSLDTNTRQAAGQFVASLAQDDPTVAQQKMAGLASFQPSLAPALNFAWKYAIGPAATALAQAKASGDPQAIAAAQDAYTNQLGSVAKQAMTVPEMNSATAPQAGTLNKGTDIVPTVSTPSFLGSKPSITVGATPIAQAQITPAQAQTVTSDASGNPAVITRDVNGGVTGVQGVGANAPKPFFLPSGETPDTLKQVQGYRTNANIAAQGASNQAFNANQIIKYAEEGFTGNLKDWASKWSGGLIGKGDPATETQLLGHSIAQQTASLADSAGLSGSNAKVALAAEMTADGQWTKDAIQSSARVMRAIGSTGAKLYNAGMENAVKQGGPFTARTFQNDWANAANVDGIRLYDAMKNQSADPNGLKQVVKSLGGDTSTRYMEATHSIDVMGSLIKGGQ